MFQMPGTPLNPEDYDRKGNDTLDSFIPPIVFEVINGHRVEYVQGQKL